MQITFLIGNGFDIHMGIASAYKMAEANYIGIPKKDPQIQSFQKSLQENGDYWSNFEAGLGKYTNEFKEDQQADFQLCLDDFTEELIKYLQAEEEKIDYELCLEEIKKEFTRSLSKYDADIPNKYKKELNSIIESGGDVVFRFVSFNYTHIFDQCIQQSFDNYAVVGTHTLRGGNYNHMVDTRVLHIHGELPGPIIMGVDNQNQIANEKWADQIRFKQKIVKPEVNSRAGSLIDDEVIRLIDESNIICIYGMSLGETDKTWWKQIAGWLRSEDHRLVLFCHNNDYSRTGFTHQRQFDIQDRIIDKFFEMAEISSANRDTVVNKILVIINPNLFNTDLVQLTKQKKHAEEIEKDTNVKHLTAEYEKYQKLAELEK